MKKNVIIIILMVLVLSMGGYLIYNKVIHNDANCYQQKKSDDKKESKEKEVTKESIEEFLNPLSSGAPNYNLLVDYTKLSEEDIFILAIKYLVATNTYKSKNDLYVFSQKDISNLASKYFMKEDFNYITDNSNFTYNKENKTYTSELGFGVFNMFYAELDRNINNYEINDDEIIVDYSLKFYTDMNQFGSDIPKNIQKMIGLENQEILKYVIQENYNYEIILEVENDDYKIKSITKK